MEFTVRMVALILLNNKDNENEIMEDLSLVV